MTDIREKAPPKSSQPLDMHDPADHDVHDKDANRPYAPPGKTKVVGKPKDDTVDPAEADPDAPHDRGTVRDGKYERGIESMRRKVDNDEAWRKGETQD